MRKPLIAAAVAKFKADAKRRREIPDTGTPGLRVVIQPSGAKSFAMRFRRPDGRSGKLVLGPVMDVESADDPQIGMPLTLGMARQLAAKVLRERTRGIDVIAERQISKRRERSADAERCAGNFQAAAIAFIREHETRWGRPRRWRHTAHALGLHWPAGMDPAGAEPSVIPDSVVDRWASKPVSEIDANAVHHLLQEARRLGVGVLPTKRPGRRRKPIASDSRAGGLHAALSQLFAWLLRHRRVAANPAANVWHGNPPKARERTLSPSEIVRVWHAADQVNPLFGAAVKVLLLTGARRAEVGGMRHSELGEAGAMWTLPSARTKNHREHRIPLSGLARDIIAGLPRIEGDFVFTRDGRRPINHWSRDKKRLDALLQDMLHWTLHDLRRTAVTNMVELGIAPHVVELVVNHVSGHRAGVAGIYNRSEMLPERKVALERWAAHVEGLVSGSGAKIVALRS